MTPPERDWSLLLWLGCLCLLAAMIAVIAATGHPAVVACGSSPVKRPKPAR